MTKRNKIRLEVPRQTGDAPRPVFMNLFDAWHEWWKGFDVRNDSDKPNDLEKQQMQAYPIVASIIENKYLPLLSCHFNLDGDERQVQHVEIWLKRYYRRCAKLMLQRAITKGYAVAERIIEPIDIDGRPHWMHTGSFVPDPDDCALSFAKDKPEIDGFTFGSLRVDRYNDKGDWNMPGMVYWNYNGDEVSLPYGDSILNRLCWPWRLVMKTWTSMTVYQRLHSPFIKYFYTPEMYGDTANKSTDLAREKAQTDLKAMKSTQGVAVPLVRNAVGDYVRGPDLDVVAPPDREPSFNEAIKTLNTLMYVSVNFPERLIEQFLGVGSKSQTEVQKDFYTEYNLASEVEMHQHFMKVWFLDPMLEVNFGKIDCTIDATVSDEQREKYAKILAALIQNGQTAGILDIAQIAEKAGVPIAEVNAGPTIETAERKTLVRGVDFAQTRGDEKAKLKKWAEKVVRAMGGAVDEVKNDMYAVLKSRLDEQHGKMAQRIDRLFKNGSPKRVDLQKAVQIPNSVYAGMIEMLVEAWDTGQRWHCEHAGLKPMSEPSRAIMQQLRTLDDVFTGSEYLAGEGELLERRLYRVLYNVRPEDALTTLNSEWREYIEKTLPIRIQDVVHQANGYGTKDFARYLQLKRAEKERA